jgi:hypothetical protein
MQKCIIDIAGFVLCSVADMNESIKVKEKLKKQREKEKDMPGHPSADRDDELERKVSHRSLRRGLYYIHTFGRYR